MKSTSSLTTSEANCKCLFSFFFFSFETNAIFLLRLNGNPMLLQIHMVNNSALNHLCAKYRNTKTNSLNCKRRLPNSTSVINWNKWKRRNSPWRTRIRRYQLTSSNNRSNPFFFLYVFKSFIDPLFLFLFSLFFFKSFLFFLSEKTGLVKERRRRREEGKGRWWGRFGGRGRQSLGQTPMRQAPMSNISCPPLPLLSPLPHKKTNTKKHKKKTK